MADSVPSTSFESSVLLHVKDDEEAKIFARRTDFLSGRYFLKTKFHETFLTHIQACILGMTNWNYVSGIQGLGKTSSVLYYVLECRKNGNDGIHYFDLEKIISKDKKLKTFSEFSEKFDDGHCVIVDHVTMHNSHYLDKIKEITSEKEINFILIETGFTACAHYLLDFGKDLQLNEDSFLRIWKGSLQSLGYHNSSLTAIGNEIYALFSERFIVTPKLLHSVLDYFMKRSGLTVAEVLRQYTLDRQNEIASFKGCQPDSSKEYEKFQLHTTILLEYIPDRGECIFTEDEAIFLKVAVNIFEMKKCRVTRNDLETNLEVLRLDLNEGDFYIKVRHLVPYLANEWCRRLPFHLEDMLEEVASDEIFAIMFQNGGARKEFKKLLIETQQKVGLVILPEVEVSETVYFKSDIQHNISQTNGLKFVVMPSQNFRTPDKSLDSYQNDLPENFKGHLRNVALFGVYLKQQIASRGDFVAFPQSQNFMGFDYFVHQQIETEENCPPQKKAKTKKNSVLYLIQVATGCSHRGDTMGKALDVMKKIFSDEDVTLHAVVIIARDDDKPYTLNRCSFKNLSVINLYMKNSDGIQNILQMSRLLYRFYTHLIENKLDAAHFCR
ncbi:uncharacterized protein LOC127726024 [Mytilus californianus]|uniref:uncharacterized protein LOC127726024 n=1 Tax=Mytilus californianus TaxID=6549 RepID=UPI002248240B|nr:uncharacterized protein LOC127726024 [Mytilus californianus]